VSEVEVFAEAVPTTLVMTFLMVQGLLNDGVPHQLLPGSVGAMLIGEDYCLDDRTNGRHEQCSAWYISPSYYMFFITYATSIVSSSIGLAKCLKVGPCRVLAESSLCSGRFLLLFLSMGFTLDSKGLALGFALGDANLSKNALAGFGLALATMFLPGLVLGLLTLCHYRQAARDVLAHPSLLLLPTVTHYTFSATRDGETRLAFSRPWTFANLALSVIGHLVYGPSVYMLVQGQQAQPARLEAWRFYLYTLAVPLLGGLLTLLFLGLDRCYFCRSCSPDMQYAVMKPSDPMVEFVKVKNKREGTEEVVRELEEIDCSAMFSTLLHTVLVVEAHSN
jgi:hypothetical protein